MVENWALSLHDSDKQIIVDRQWLWGTSSHLSALQFLLKTRLPQINGLEDTALVLREENTIDPDSVQVLHIAKWKSLDNLHIRYISLLHLIMMPPF